LLLLLLGKCFLLLLVFLLLHVLLHLLLVRLVHTHVTGGLSFFNRRLLLLLLLSGLLLNGGSLLLSRGLLRSLLSWLFRGNLRLLGSRLLFLLLYWRLLFFVVGHLYRF
jgi:hypothetical protein